MTFDVATLLLVLAFAVSGAASGFSAQVLSACSLAGGIVLAPRLAAPIAPEIAAHWPALGPDAVALLARVVACVAFWLVSGLAVTLFVRLIRRVSVVLSASDRAGGAVLGAGKGAVFSLIVAVGWVAVTTPARVTPEDSVVLRVATGLYGIAAGI